MKKNISNCLVVSKKNVTFFAIELRFLLVETQKSELLQISSLYNKEKRARKEQK